MDKSAKDMDVAELAQRSAEKMLEVAASALLSGEQLHEHENLAKVIEALDHMHSQDPNATLILAKALLINGGKHLAHRVKNIEKKED